MKNCLACRRLETPSYETKPMADNGSSSRCVRRFKHTRPGNIQPRLPSPDFRYSAATTSGFTALSGTSIVPTLCGHWVARVVGYQHIHQNSPAVDAQSGSRPRRRQVTLGRPVGRHGQQKKEGVNWVLHRLAPSEVGKRSTGAKTHHPVQGINGGAPRGPGNP